jgi:hypothetical protein
MNFTQRRLLLTRRWGATVSNPTQQQCGDAVTELAQSDPEHPDCSLRDLHGWFVSIFARGLVVLENIETDAGPWHMRDVPKETALVLWRLLETGDLAGLRAQAWHEGYGR